MSPDERYIVLDGAHNFRDFGGYDTQDGASVKKGVLFRSDALNKLSESDFEKLSPLGIRTICDLRREKESMKAPTSWTDPTARILQMPMFSDSGPSFAEKIAALGEELSIDVIRKFTLSTYLTLLTSAQAHQYYRQIFSLLAEKEHVPILIHCSGGKDRTGMACALTQWLLGVSREDIVTDYLYSQSLYGDRVEVMKAPPQMLEVKGFAELGPDVLKLIFGVQPEFIHGAFAYLDESGITPDSFLPDFLGMDGKLRDQLRRNLLEN